MSSPFLSPRIAKGFYPEKKAFAESRFDAAFVSFVGTLTRRFHTRTNRLRSIVERVNEIGESLKDGTDDELKAQVGSLSAHMQSSGLDFDSVARSFALVREIAGRRIGMRHFDVQLMGGWVLLQGMVAEMETGEGKTLTATLPACTAALAGIPVHIITVNDYLARRDAAWMGPVYEAVGLSVGVIAHGMSPEERRAAYRCDVTYCTNKEVVFDYLKDRLTMGRQPGFIQMRLERLYSTRARLDQLLLRGLPFAIVDEADSVLIDEARTPLIISGPVDNTCEKEVYSDALSVAGQLERDKDFTVDQEKRTLELTERGKDRVKSLTESLGPVWAGKHRREEMVQQALTAINFFARDREYIVREGKVQIVDEYTGRVMADRSWERGLHQMIEAKEGCDITTQNETLARISYQRFFRRYRHLAGMTGTAREVANELWSVYRLRVAVIPTNRPLSRITGPLRVYHTAEGKWAEIVKRIRDLHAEGRPVLVGTRSVGTSEHLSELLSCEGLPHRVLNARQDREEAEIIAQAGQRGMISVATNMAGRGTDIVLGPGVRELKGLHVIATELHDARRIDRQLFGRCGRQGDPGSYEAIVSLEDSLFDGYREKTFGAIALRVGDVSSVFGRRISGAFASFAQRTTQRRHFRARKELLKLDESLGQAMAFSGRGE